MFPHDRAETANKPVTIAEIALHQAPDREQVLNDGAKREGQVTYNSLTSLAAVAQEFERNIPSSRCRSGVAIQRALLSESQRIFSGRLLADVIETSGAAMTLLHRKRLSEYYRLRLGYDEVKRVKIGVYYLAIDYTAWASTS
jgi:hypothetical protein